MSGPSDKAVHATARMLCYWRNRDWRYDPADPAHDHWRDKAAQTAVAAHDPRLGLDRSVCLRDVVDRLKNEKSRPAESVALTIERELGGQS